MRNLIYVAVIVHVAFTAAGLELQGKEVEFGDMIAYPPSCKLRVRYQHYAVYVDDKFPGQGNQFERLKDAVTLKPTCIFSPLDVSVKPYVFNFLDGYVGKNGDVYTKGTEKEMMARITQKQAKCGLYNLLTNNCEHLATYVRYGKKISLQFNMTGEFLCHLPLRKEAEAMWKYVKEHDNAASSVNPVGLTCLSLIALSLCSMSF